MKWIRYSEQKPPLGQEVLAYHPDWVDEDFNPKGTRTGFQNLSEGDDGDFVSAHYWSYQDCYMTISHSECDDNPSFSDEIRNSIEPELWISLDSLTDRLPQKCKTVVLNGLTWDTENLVLNGKTHFTYREALNIAKASGKRLPSKKEFVKLFRLPHEWDNDKQGMWFAEHSEDLKGEKSLFLPAVGFRVYCDTTMSGVGESGYYWSCTPDGIDYAYYLVFNNFDTLMNSSVRRYGSSVRCVHIQTKKKL